MAWSAPKGTSQGQYGQGNVQAAYKALQDLKQQVTDGKLSLTDYQAQADPIVKQATNWVQQIAGGGSGAASAVNPIWQSMQNDGFVTSKGGQWASQLPFSTQEYAKLPDNVRPTQDDVNNGLFDPATAPSTKLRSATPTDTGGAAPGGTGAPQPGAVGPDGKPLPGINPSLVTGDTRTGQGQLDVQGNKNASALQDALNKQYQVNQQAVGQLGDSLKGIPGVYTQEGQSEQNQMNALADQQKTARSQGLTDLAGILAQNQQNQFNQAIPDLAEQANTAGIYRSTGFGNILAQKYANLTADTQNQLAMQGLSDRNTDLQARQGALQQNLGYQGQAANAQASGMQTTGAAYAGALQAYGSGLGDVANAQIGMQNAGLQRQFSLQDYSTQYANALQLANQAKTGQSGKSTGTQQAIQTGLGVGQIGVGAASGNPAMVGKGAATTAGSFSPNMAPNQTARLGY